MKKLLLLLSLSSTLFSNTLHSKLEAIINKHGFSKESVSLYFVDPATDSVHININAKARRIPASVQKLYTGAVAIEKLSLQHNFKTEVYLSSFDKKTGIASGKTVLKGYGDPGLTAERLWLLATHLKQRGITKFIDTLMIDNSYFDETTIGPGFNNSKSCRAYMAPVSALSASFNAFAIFLQPRDTGMQALMTTLPKRDGLKIQGTVQTTSDAKGKSLSALTFFDGSESVVKLQGVIAKDRNIKAFYRKVWDPEKHFANCFIAVCKEAGIEIGNIVIKKGKAPQKVSPFYTFHSEPLFKHVSNMFKYSNNYVAESIFKAIASHEKGEGSWPAATATCKEWYTKTLKATTITMPNFINGSGMGTANKTSAKEVVTLLNYVLQKPSWQYEFITALPVSGIDGTLKNRLNSSILKGKIRAKTGTLGESGVNNLAGYIYPNGKTISFALLLKDSSKRSYAHWQLQHELLEEILSSLSKKKPVVEKGKQPAKKAVKKAPTS